MTDATKVPGNKPRHRKRNSDGTSCFAGTVLVVSGCRASRVDNSACRVARPAESSWPFKAEHTLPLAWWRTLPSDSFRDAERLLVLAALDGIAVLDGGEDFAAAIGGDAATAVRAAFSVMPIKVTTLMVDVVMTTVLRCALDGHVPATLVLAQVLGLTDLGHAFGTELAASWYTQGLRYSAHQRRFSQAETELLKAFRDRNGDGERA